MLLDIRHNQIRGRIKVCNFIVQSRVLRLLYCGEHLQHPDVPLYGLFSSSRFGLSRTAPGFAGIEAPDGAADLLLKSSHICSIVTHSTPSLVFMYSMILLD